MPAIHAHGYPNIAASLAPFWRSVAETAAWCTPRADPARPRECLRTAELAPRPLEPSYADAVATVVVQRGMHVRVAAGTGAPAAARGRLLVYFPDAELQDGAAEAETGGFLDVHNCPPHDTWVAFYEDARAPTRSHLRYLVAWVPEAFVPSTERGIRADPERCVTWLDAAGVSLAALARPAMAG